MPSPYGEQDAQEYVLATEAAWREGTGGFFAIVDVGTSEPVGSIAIHVIDSVFGNVEVGYWAAAEADLALGDRGGRGARAVARRRAQQGVAARRRKGRVHPRGHASVGRVQPAAGPADRLRRVLIAPRRGRVKASRPRARNAPAWTGESSVSSQALRCRKRRAEATPSTSGSSAGGCRSGERSSTISTHGRSPTTRPSSAGGGRSSRPARIAYRTVRSRRAGRDGCRTRRSRPRSTPSLRGSKATVRSDCETAR